MPRKRSWLVVALVLALAALVTAGCGSDKSGGGSSSASTDSGNVTPAGGTAWAGGDANAKAVNDLYDAAVKAGQTQVVMYGPYAELYRPIWQEFSKRFPKVQIVPKVLPGSGTVAALQAEVSSGRGVGDVTMQGLEGVAVPADKGLLMPYEPPTIGDLAKDFRDPQNRFVVQFGDIYGTMYNTNKMKEADLPKKVSDLGESKYKGEVIDNPALGIVTAFCLMPNFQAKQLTLDDMKGLKATAKVVDDTTPFYNQIVTGQVAMMPWGSYMQYQRLKAAGAPVGFDAVPGMSSLILGGTGIIKSAPHPDAAKLFQAWFLTPEAQNLLVSKGQSVALMPGIKYPGEWPDYHKLYDALPQVKPSDFDQVLTEFMNWVKPVFS